jgi:NAD(P)-dependent dehydrogenase (short-subunit alcohol dehydrogenase family)
MDQLSFDGRVAVITGAGRGLGRAHALTLAERGARVVVNDLAGAEDPAAEVVDEVRALGGEAVADGHSVADRDGAHAVVQTALDAFGRVDVVVNNAGILRDRSFPRLSVDDLDAVLDVHLRGTFFVSQAAWPHLKEQGYGRIVNTTSVAGYLGNFGQANYGAAKLGIVGLSKVLSVEGAKHGIATNVIAPGARTRMTEELLGPLADALDPELVSAAVAWLAHEDCSVNGEILQAGGGRVARVFIAQTQGIFDAKLTPELVAERFEEVMDLTDHVVPATFAEELELLTRHL